MDDAPRPVTTPHTTALSPAAADQVLPLPSGATLSVRADAAGEDIRIRSANGSIELRIRMTDDGPVLSLSGVRLEIDAADSVALRCRELAIEARDGMRVTTGGDFEVRSDAEVRLRSAGDTYVDADYLKLNCQDRAGYHDAAPEADDAAARAPAEEERPADR